MEKLTEEQIEQAAKAMHEANKSAPQIWKEMSPHLKEWYRNLTSAAAPYLQVLWEQPTEDEIDRAQKLLSARYNDGKWLMSTCLIRFVAERNAALQPKPVDPRREKIEKVISEHCGHALGLVTPGLTDKIIAALNEKP